MTRNAALPDPNKNAAVNRVNAALPGGRGRPTARSVRLQIEQEEKRRGSEYTRAEWSDRFEKLFGEDE